MIKIILPLVLGKYSAMCLGPFVLLRDKNQLTDYTLLNHEMIHFFQQLELVLVIHWILYVFFYLTGRAKGLDHDQAYRNNPFEREAYANEADLLYVLKRTPYAWVKYLKRRR
jgi:hypothetical protein